MLNKGKMKIIGVVLSGAQDEATGEYLYYISERAKELNYKLLIFNTFTQLYDEDNPDDPAKAIYKIINYDILDGIIILAETIKSQSVIDTIVFNAKIRNIPLVLFQR